MAAGGELTLTWSGQVIEEVVRRDASGKSRSCTQVQPAPPGRYRLSLCSPPEAGRPGRCAAISFCWRPAAGGAEPQVLRWSDSAALPAP